MMNQNRYASLELFIFKNGFRFIPIHFNIVIVPPMMMRLIIDLWGSGMSLKKW